jgi:hypothetical protein
MTFKENLPKVIKMTTPLFGKDREVVEVNNNDLTQ